MRIENGNLAGVGNSGSTSGARALEADSRLRGAEADDSSSDSVKLSNASNLIALAKNVASADRQSRIANLASQVQSGSYQVNLADVSQAILKTTATGSA